MSSCAAGEAHLSIAANGPSRYPKVDIAPPVAGRAVFKRLVAPSAGSPGIAPALAICRYARPWRASKPSEIATRRLWQSGSLVAGISTCGSNSYLAVGAPGNRQVEQASPLLTFAATARTFADHASRKTTVREGDITSVFNRMLPRLSPHPVARRPNCGGAMPAAGRAWPCGRPSCERKTKTTGIGAETDSETKLRIWSTTRSPSRLMLANRIPRASARSILHSFVHCCRPATAKPLINRRHDVFSLHRLSSRAARPGEKSAAKSRVSSCAVCALRYVPPPVQYVPPATCPRYLPCTQLSASHIHVGSNATAIQSNAGIPMATHRQRDLVEPHTSNPPHANRSLAATQFRRR